MFSIARWAGLCTASTIFRELFQTQGIRSDLILLFFCAKPAQHRSKKGQRTLQGHPGSWCTPALWHLWWPGKELWEQEKSSTASRESRLVGNGDNLGIAFQQSFTWLRVGGLTSFKSRVTDSCFYIGGEHLFLQRTPFQVIFTSLLSTEHQGRRMRWYLNTSNQKRVYITFRIGHDIPPVIAAKCCLSTCCCLIYLRRSWRDIPEEFLILCFCLQGCSSHDPFLVKWPEQQQLIRQECKFKHPNLSESACATADPVKGDDKPLGSYQVSSEIREGPIWKEMYGQMKL